MKPRGSREIFLRLSIGKCSVVSDRVNDRSDPLTGQRGQKGQSTLTRSNAKRGNKFGVVKDNEIYNITYKSCGWNSNVKNVKGRIA